MRLLYIVFCFAPALLFGQNRIAYLSDQSGNFDIYTIDENGENRKQLTKNPGWDWSPQWNESLGAIIYNSTDSSDQLFIRCMSKNGIEKKLDTGGQKEFIMSPNSKYALYTLQDNQNNYIGIYDLSLKENRLIITDPSYNGRPKWSPKSDQFSFISDRNGNQDLYLYNLAAKSVTRLTYSEKREKYVSWHPNGVDIYYTYHYSDQKGREHNDIFVLSINTFTSKQITTDRFFYQEICVSPDGKKIAFHAKINGKDQIYTMDIDGSNLKRVTSVNAYHGEPIWLH